MKRRLSEGFGLKGDLSILDDNDDESERMTKKVNKITNENGSINIVNGKLKTTVVSFIFI